MNKKLIPCATPGQKHEIDVLMKELGVSDFQMIELGGRDVARLAVKKSKGPILIFCGKGKDASYGLCAAKHLMNWNIPVAVILVEDEKILGKEEKVYLKTLKYMRASVFRYDFPDMQKVTSRTDLIIDALSANELKNKPKSHISKAISFINRQNKKVLAVEIATGIDGLTGESHKPCIRADYTLALGISLKGSINNKNSGKHYVSDIGIPDSVYHAVKLETKPRFHKSEILKL